MQPVRRRKESSGGASIFEWLAALPVKQFDRPLAGIKIAMAGATSTMFRGYVLTIDDGARRQSIAQELANVPFPWEFVEGVRAAPDLYSPIKNLLYAKRSLAPAEVACYAGHRLIWQKVATAGTPYGIIFEDDVRIVDPEAFDQALGDAIGFDIVKLHDFEPKEVILRKSAGKTELVMHRLIASSAACYIISRHAAERLLARKTIYRAVDEDFSHPWEFGIDIWSVWPNPVSDKKFASAIQGGREAMRKNPLRSLYGNVLQATKKVRMAATVKRVKRRIGRDPAALAVRTFPAVENEPMSEQV